MGREAGARACPPPTPHPPTHPPTPHSDARVFVTSGCACSPDVPDLLMSLRVLPAGTDPAMSVSGIVNLLQASKCATTALGGPIVNTCVGSAGCAASA